MRNTLLGGLIASLVLTTTLAGAHTILVSDFGDSGEGLQKGAGPTLSARLAAKLFSLGFPITDESILENSELLNSGTTGPGYDLKISGYITDLGVNENTSRDSFVGIVSTTKVTAWLSVHVVIANAQGQVLTERDLYNADTETSQDFSLGGFLELSGDAVGRYGATEDIMRVGNIVKYASNKLLLEEKIGDMKNPVKIAADRAVGDICKTAYVLCK